jgi:hypothetical protein
MRKFNSMPCALAFFAAACGSGAHAVPTLANPTSAVCPAGVHADVRGYFSETCVESIIPWKFSLPSIHAQYLPPIFEIDPGHPDILFATYIPRGGGFHLFMQIVPKGRIYGVDDSLKTSPGGNLVGFGYLDAGFTGSWEDATSTYEITVASKESVAAERLIMSIADSTLDHHAAR